MKITGINNNGQFNAFLTYVIIFIANILYLLPKGTLPTPLDVYDAFIRASFATIVIWLANKGIQWRSEGKK